MTSRISLRLAVAAWGLLAVAGHAQLPAPVQVGALGYGLESEYRLLERALEHALRMRPERPLLSYRIKFWPIEYNSAAEDAGIESLKSFRPDIVLLLSPDLVAKVLERVERVPVIVHGQGHMARMPFFETVARPGGRVTGFIRDPASLAKRVELLQGFCTSIRRVGILIGEEMQREEFFRDFVAAENRRLRANDAVLVPLYTRGLELLPSLAETVRAQRLDALIISVSTEVRDNFGSVTAAMRALGLPHIYNYVDVVERGGALGAQPAPYDIAKTSAEYISRIAHGENAGEIPVQIRRAYDIAVHTERIKDFRGCEPRRIAKIATRFFP